MKTLYIQPNTRVFEITMGQIISTSDSLRRGLGHGNNNAEARDMLFEFDDEEE